MSTWCEQYIGIRRHAQTGSTQSAMFDGYTRWTMSHCFAPRYHASLTPVLYDILLCTLNGLTIDGRFGLSNEVSRSFVMLVEKTCTSWPSLRMQSMYCRKRIAMPCVCGGM